jgi:hypothetical protein
MRTQNQNVAAQQAQSNKVAGMIAGGMQSGPGAAEQALMGFGGGANAPQQIDMGQLGLPNMAGQANFNAGQDALMQMVRRDASQQLGSAGGYLDELARTGGQQNVDDLMSALNTQFNANTQEQVARQNASVSGLGQLGGTASRFAEARLRNRALIDQNAMAAQTRSTAMENAMNRRLSAAGQLGNMNLQAFQNQMGAANALGGFAQMQAGSEQGAANTRLGAMQANQTASLNAGQQNLAALQGAGQLAGQRAGQNNALIALAAQQGAVMRPMGNPAIEAGITAQALPGIMNRINGSQAARRTPFSFGGR